MAGCQLSHMSDVSVAERAGVAVTNTWSFAGVPDPIVHSAYRLRAASMNSTTQWASGDPSRPHETLMRVEANVRLPVASGVPTFIFTQLPLPAASKTLPVTWS